MESEDRFTKVSIVIPVYNEENTLEKIIAAVENANTFYLEKEIILVDDCSKDNSRDILEQYKNRHKVYRHQTNKGKGAALKTGFQHTTGDIIF